MSRLAKSFALLLSFAGLLLGATNANALACTSAATGNWNAAATWLAPCNIAGGPVAGDTVTIAAAHTVTVTIAAAATSITIAPPSVAHGININPGIALNVSGAITMTAPAANFASTLAVGSGTLTAGSIAINGGTTATRISQVTVSTGTITVTGAVTMGGTAAQSRFIATGASTITVGGAFSPGAFTPGASTLTVSGNFTPTAMVANTGTVILTGGAAQSMRALTTYNNVIISKTVGTIATLAGNTSMTGSLTVTSGTLNKNTRTLGVAGNLAVNGVITGTTGNITLSGAAATINGTGSITTTTGVLSITTAKTILATANLTIASPITLSANVTVTNNGIINKTTTTALNGANATTSIWVNAAISTLNYAGTNAPMATGVLNAAAVPNTVNYTGAAQAVKATTYHHLGFGGSLAKTAAAGLTVNGDFTMSGAASFTAGTFTHNFAGNWIVNTTAVTPLSVSGASVINFNTPAVPAPTSMGGTTTATLAFADVNINNTSGVTFNDNASFQTGTTPTLTVAVGATLTPAAAVVISGTPGGTLTGSGTVQVTRITAGTANFSSQYTIVTKTLTNLTVDYAGAAAQTVSVLTYGSATGGGLKVSNASGVSLTANTTVAGTLTLASGAVSTGAFTLIVSKACNAPSVVRTGGHVAGFLQKNIPVGAPVNCTFEVGDAATYRPIDTTFVSVATAGNLVGSVSQAAGEHPQCCGATPFGLDSAKDVNRYWSITNPGGIVFTTYSATFNFINPTDFDAGANPANFEVEFWNGAWNTTTFGTRTLTSTQASGIAAFGDFAVGEKRPTNPGSFNAFETGTAAGAITGVIKTRIAGSAFSLDVVAISGGAQMNTFTNAVKVDLLGNTVTGVGLDGNNCPVTFTVTQAVSPNPTITAGRSTVNFAAVGDAWKDVRVRISFPALSPTIISCSTDNFAIRPNGLSVSVTDADWQTAGIARTLNNSGATGGNVHKAGQPFTISATAQNAVGVTTTNYTGSPTVKTLACTLPATCTNGTLTPGAWSGSGTVTTSTASYNEAGAFNLTFEDQVFAGVDSADSTLLERTIPQSAAAAVGRFVPDHFDATVLITPTFKTFNAADAACSAGAAPRRTFTYIGQPFGYLIAPQATILARNAAGATTVNYRGTGAGGLWKVAASDITQTYSNNAVGPLLDTTLIGAPSVTDNLDGTGTVASAATDQLAYQRSTAAPSALFNANLSLAVSAQDAAENAANQGIITSTTTALFNGTGSGIDFDGGGASNGKEFRYGQVKLSNAYGSELLDLPIPIQTQYWDATTSGFATNAADHCTTLLSANIALVKTPPGCAAGVSGNVSFNSGLGNLKLTKPGAKCTADMTVNLAAELPTKAYLQGKWSGVNYDQNPTARATFGVYKGNNEFIYLREMY